MLVVELYCGWSYPSNKRNTCIQGSNCYLFLVCTGKWNISIPVWHKNQSEKYRHLQGYCTMWLHIPLMSDSDRQAEKLPLWWAVCEWQSWFISVCHHELRSGGSSTGSCIPACTLTSDALIRTSQPQLRAEFHEHMPSCSRTGSNRGPSDVERDFLDSANREEILCFIWIFASELHCLCLQKTFAHVCTQNCPEDPFSRTISHIIFFIKTIKGHLESTEEFRGDECVNIPVCTGYRICLFASACIKECICGYMTFVDLSNVIRTCYKL